MEFIWSRIVGSITALFIALGVSVAPAPQHPALPTTSYAPASETVMNTDAPVSKRNPPSAADSTRKSGWHSQIFGAQSDAVKAGKRISNGFCEGEGAPYKLSVSPMKKEDFSFIVPYGAMIGGHVTPIDHQYFSPTVFHSSPDTYEVRAMADSKLVNYELHPTRVRLIFSISCTYFYYYDLLTSVEPEIKSGRLPIGVKAGDLIGHIGGQTLDFAVWDTTKPLTGFIVPEHYDAEPWKMYTVDPLDYYTDELKAMILSKYVRTAEPRSGKIDYDIDGKIIGNWFEEGTVGYGGSGGQTSEQRYWTGQLSISPDSMDPRAFIVSVGYLEEQGSQNQFSIPKDSPNPATVGVGEGLIKYDLKDWRYLTTDGSDWTKMAHVNGGVTLENAMTDTKGCALVQLLETRVLKFDTIMGKPCSSVDGFTSTARIYRR